MPLIPPSTPVLWLVWYYTLGSSTTPIREWRYREGGDGQGLTVASLFDMVEDMDQEPCLAVCYAVMRGRQCLTVQLPVNIITLGWAD